MKKTNIGLYVCRCKDMPINLCIIECTELRGGLLLNVQTFYNRFLKNKVKETRVHLVLAGVFSISKNTILERDFMCVT